MMEGKDSHNKYQAQKQDNVKSRISPLKKVNFS